MKIHDGDRDYILKLKQDLLAAKIIIVTLMLIGVMLFILSYNEANALYTCAIQ